MTPNGTPIWYELLTPDPDAAARFYGAVLGWRVGPTPSGGMDYRMIEAADGGHAGGVMRLTGEMAAGGARPGWTAYLCADDVDAAAARVAALGGAVLLAPWDIPGAGRAALVAHPAGGRFYLMRGATEGAESTAFSRARPGRCAWNELATPDPDAALALFGDLFGWRPGGAMPMGDGREYRFVMAGDVLLGGFLPAPGEAEAGWTFTFRASDARAAADRVRAAGGVVRSGPTEVPGGDLSVTAADPEGTPFGVVSGGVSGG